MWTRLVVRVRPARDSAPPVLPRRPYPVGVAESEVLTFSAVYSTVEDGWVQAQLAELPAVVTAAPTRAEAEELLVDALREYLASFVAASQVDTSSSADTGAVDLFIHARGA